MSLGCRFTHLISVLLLCALMLWGFYFLGYIQCARGHFHTFHSIVPYCSAVLTVLTRLTTVLWYTLYCRFRSRESRDAGRSAPTALRWWTGALAARRSHISIPLESETCFLPAVALVVSPAAHPAARAASCRAVLLRHLPRHLLRDNADERRVEPAFHSLGFRYFQKHVLARHT